MSARQYRVVQITVAFRLHSKEEHLLRGNVCMDIIEALVMKLLSGVIFFAVVMTAQMWGVHGFSNEPDEYELLQKTFCLLETLLSRSESQLSKMEDIESKLSSLHYGFGSINKDLYALESASSEQLVTSNELNDCLEEHKGETASDLGLIQQCLFFALQTLIRIERFVHPCGGNGWHTLVSLDFSHPTTDCPDGWMLHDDTVNDYPLRTCGRLDPGLSTCSQATFPVDKPYSKVCGRIKGYQIGNTNGFEYSNIPLDMAYVNGVSITHDESGSPEHIWTFVASLEEGVSAPMDSRCPCDGGDPPPDFIDRDYFCESALDDGESGGGADSMFFLEDPLWDGEDCMTNSCCEYNNPPYFVKTLPTVISEPIDVRICLDAAAAVEDVAIEVIELYVKYVDEDSDH